MPTHDSVRNPRLQSGRIKLRFKCAFCGLRFRSPRQRTKHANVCPEKKERE